jgi:hypothetical protein
MQQTLSYRFPLDRRRIVLLCLFSEYFYGGIMSIRLLIDGFVANPDEFYSLVTEEVTKRELPDLKFSWSEDAESTRLLFNRGDKAKRLTVSCKGEGITVLGYQIGNCFHVSTRTLWETENHKAGYLFFAIRACFETVVDRAVKQALSRHMEGRRAPVPEFLRVDKQGELAEAS